MRFWWRVVSGVAAVFSATALILVQTQVWKVSSVLIVLAALVCGLSRRWVMANDGTAPADEDEGYVSYRVESGGNAVVSVAFNREVERLNLKLPDGLRVAQTRLTNRTR